MTLAMSEIRRCQTEYSIMMWKKYRIVILGRLHY